MSSWQLQELEGAGIVLTAEGEVLTNAHVVHVAAMSLVRSMRAQG